MSLAPPPGLTSGKCAAPGVSRASVHRRRVRLIAPPPVHRARSRPARAPTGVRQRVVLEVLHSPRLAGQAPAEIHAIPLNDGVCHCSIRAMYRLLGQHGEVRERRRLLRHPVYQKPELLADPGVARSHNRPHTSNDNPFPKSHFKTLKYQPRFPQRFASIEDARNLRRRFFDWHDQDHHHAGIGLMTPDQVHFGQVDAVHAARQVALDRAFAEHPARFVNKAPVPFGNPRPRGSTGLRRKSCPNADLSHSGRGQLNRTFDPAVGPARVTDFGGIRWAESMSREVAVGRKSPFPPLSFGGSFWFGRIPARTPPLIESDMRIFGIRLSNKTSRLRGRRYPPMPRRAPRLSDVTPGANFPVDIQF